MQKMKNAVTALAILAVMITVPVFAQAPPPMLPPEQLDQLVARIALYPDPLLAQIMAAATYSNDIPAAAQWADEHHYLTGKALADAIAADQLPWDPSVQALLPFPSVLDMMNADMNWTSQLGDAFLAQQQDVMDAVQRQRAVAQRYGYLRTNGQIVVSGGPYITILPVDPGFIVCPYYDPAIVFFAPRAGFVVGGAIRFGFGVSIGGFFAPWGWSRNSLRPQAGTVFTSVEHAGTEPGLTAALTFTPATPESVGLDRALHVPPKVMQVERRSEPGRCRGKAGQHLAKRTGGPGAGAGAVDSLTIRSRPASRILPKSSHAAA